LSLASTVRLRFLLAGGAGISLMILAHPLLGSPQAPDSQRSASLSGAVSTAAPVKKLVLREPIPYSTLRKATSQLRSGTSRTVQSGKNGEKESTYQVYSRPDASNSAGKSFNHAFSNTRVRRSSKRVGKKHCPPAVISRADGW